MKKILFSIFLATVVAVTAVGCSSETNSNNTEQSQELTAQDKGRVYTAIRIAEDKVNSLFHKEVAEDGTTPVLDPTFTKESAIELLSKYYDKAIAEAIVNHYITDKTVDDGKIVVNAQKYFDPSALDLKVEDVTVEGTKSEVKAKTKDGVTYELKAKDGGFLITNITK